MIVTFIEKDYREWDIHLSSFRFAYNTTFHSSLGTFPAFLNLGRELLPPNALSERDRSGMKIETRDPEEWSRRMKEMNVVREWV